MEIEQKVIYMPKSLKLARTSDIFYKWQNMLVLVKKVFVSLEVSQKLKAMNNDWYFIGFYKVWWLLKKIAKPLQRGQRLQAGPNEPNGPQPGLKQCTIKLQALSTKKDI